MFAYSSILFALAVVSIGFGMSTAIVVVKRTMDKEHKGDLLLGSWTPVVTIIVWKLLSKYPSWLAKKYPTNIDF